MIDFFIQLYIKIKYRGHTYHCPICNFNTDRWFPIGIDNQVNIEKKIIGAGRRDAGCFVCHATDRDRLLFLFLKNNLNVFNNSNQNILHIAPEKPIAKIFKQKGFKNYICGDKHEKGYSYSSNVLDLDISSLQFDIETFDLIICNHVLEHVIDDQKAMRELYRVLKPHGSAILQVPYSPLLEVSYENHAVEEKDREKHFGQHDHVRVYGLDYFDKLRNAGFKVEKINLYNTFPNCGLNPKEDVIFCKK